MIARNMVTNCKVSWEPFYKFVSLTLSPGGLNYFSAKFNRSFFDIMHKCIIYTLAMFLGSLCLFGVVLQNNFDLEDKVSCIAIFITETNVGVKVLTIIYSHELFKKLNDTIVRETSREDFESWELVLARKYYKYARLICVTFIIIYVVTLITFLLMPFFSDKSYMMPILIEIPGTNDYYTNNKNNHCSHSSSPGYEINYSFGIFNVSYAFIVEMGFDITAYLEVCFISFQLDRLMHYSNMIGDFNSAYKTHDQQSQLLKNCIKLHRDIFGFINHVATINTTVVLLIVTTTVPLMIVLQYSILLGSMSKGPCLMVAALSQLFSYCLLGNVVSSKYQEASNSLYNNQWYNIKKIEDRRAYTFFLMVSQRDMGFSAFGLYHLSLETFTEMMKLVYAGAAFLQEVI